MATVLAVHFALRGPPEPPLRASPAAQRFREERRRNARLDRRLEELEAALAASMVGEKPEEAAPDLEELVTRARLLGASDDWNARDAQKLARQIYAALATDARHHLVLMHMLERAADADAAGDLAAYLVENRFVRLARSSKVTDEIRERARKLLASEHAYLRVAAARVLYGYARPDKELYRLGIEHLANETDDGVREALVDEVSRHCRDVGLTKAEAAPVADDLRGRLAKGEAWAATALAYWSDDKADLDRVTAALRGAKTPGEREAYLNAFAADGRLGSRHAATCRAVLLDVWRDKSMDADTRGLARRLLGAYSPWDEATARAIESDDK